VVAPVGSAVEVRPLSPAIGGAVTGVDLNAGLDDATFELVREAFLAHSMLVFPGQHLGPDGQEVFAERWGTPVVHAYLAAHAVPDHPGVLRVTNMGKAQTLTENWHFDSAWFPNPPSITILAAQSLPAFGGDTMWASGYAAHDALSPTMRRLLSGLCGQFTGTLADDDGVRREVVTPHPLLHVHPETGRPSLRICRPGSVAGIEGMTPEESLPLLRFLYEHVSNHEFVYRHRWSDGDVVMWDNRCTIHYAVHDYGDAERNLHRMVIVR
jgi:taurine dioxygenase